ncbi:MAG: hypothetical protein KKA28_17385 [Planctomycetes bacterium]|nr:hypothetical protein [Planctomycetota bacterium]MCG2683951.1 hypothetical protein [Planctomycetales bacterium]
MTAMIQSGLRIDPRFSPGVHAGGGLTRAAWTRRLNIGATDAPRGRGG